MKRFVSALLAVAMLLSFCPMVLAEEAAAAVEAAQPDVTAEAAEQTAETAKLTETETPIEEETPALTVQAALTMPTADLTEEAESEVAYTKDGGTTWTPSTLADAVTAIGKQTGTIRVLKDITLTQGLYIMGDITIIPGDKDVTIKRGFAGSGEQAGIGTTGDSMFVVYKWNNATHQWYTGTAKLTLGSEADEHTLTIDGNAVERATTCQGPMIYLHGTYNSSVADKNAHITKCTINKNVILQNNTNSATNYLGDGGAITISNGVELTITGATIRNCSAGKYGGAIYYDDTQYASPYQAKINLDTVRFEGNSAQQGGAIYYDKSITTLKNCAFINNISTNSGGAAIYVKSIDSTNAEVVPMLTIDNCSFTGNQSTGHKLGSANTDYEKSNVIFSNSKPVKENTVIFKNNVTFSGNATDSDICLGTSAFGSASYNGVLYLDDSFTTNNSIKVMCGQHVVSGITSVTAPLFKCSSAAKAAEFVTRFTPVVFASSSKTDNVIQAKDAAFAVNETDNTAISLVEYEDPEVEYTYSNGDTGNQDVTKRGTLKKALATSGYQKITLLKDLTIDETILLSQSITLESEEGKQYTLSRASGFKNEMISIVNYKPTIQNIILDGNNVSGAQSILGIYEGAGGCTLKDVVLKNNKNIHSYEGGGICVHGGRPTLNAENVTIENCSAAEGGAVSILANSETSSASYTFKNCTFTNNKATAGSAVFIKNDPVSVWFNLIFDGCTFTKNDFISLSEATNNASGVSIDDATTHTVVYVGTQWSGYGDVEAAPYSTYVGLYGDTTFKDNGETVSDILLDEGFTNLKEYANLKLGTGYNGSSLFANKGNPIRIAVGSYSRANEEGKETFGYNAVKGKNIIDKSTSTNTFSGAFVLAPTYGATLSGDHLLKEDVQYFTIGEPSLVQMQYIANNSITAAALVSTNNAKKGFHYQTNGAVTLSVSPELITQYSNMSYLDQDYAYENQTYTLTAKAADNVNIKSISIKTNSSTLLNGDVADDKKSASVMITPEILTKVLANWSPICIVSIEYDQFVTLTIGEIETGKNASVIATAADGTTVSAGETKTIPAGKVTFACSGDDFGYIESAGNTIVHSGNNYYINSLTKDATVKVGCKHDVILTEVEGGTSSTANLKLAAKTNKYSTVSNNYLFVYLTPNDNYKLESVIVKTKAGASVSYDIGIYDETKNTYVDAGGNFDQLGKYALYFAMPDDDVIVTPTYKALNKTITIADTTNGTITTNPADEASPGSEVTITATADEFYELDTITVTKASGGAVIVTDNKFTMPDENVTVSATFKKKQFAVTTQTVENGTITVTIPADGKSAWGEEVEYRVEANAHYDVASITVNGETVTPSASGIYNFTMPKEDVTISATFKKHKYNITIEGGNITYTIPGAETFDWGESVMVTITPEQWYSITKVEASDSITVTDNRDGTYSFVMPSADVILTVTTTRPTYTVKFDTKGGSTVIDPQVIANGGSVAKPRAPEYLNRGFAGWYTSTDFKPENKYNFEQPVTGDITLYARWFLWGDVNGDGRADTTDAYIIQRCRVGLEKYTDMANRMAGFVSGLDKANPDTTDAYDIQRLRVGLITRFSVEDSARGYEFNLEEGTYTVPR